MHCLYVSSEIPIIYFDKILYTDIESAYFFFGILVDVLDCDWARDFLVFLSSAGLLAPLLLVVEADLEYKVQAKVLFGFAGVKRSTEAAEFFRHTCQNFPFFF